VAKRSVPEIVIVDSDTLIIRGTPYKPEFPEGLKEIVPPSNREWDPPNKEWTIWGSQYFEAVIALAKRHFPKAEVIDCRRPSSSERRIATLDQDYAQLGLLPIAQPKIVRVVYRELAKEAHPDHGGSHEAMLSLNASYERLQKAGAT
jgi:hypothetical protein